MGKLKAAKMTDEELKMVEGAIKNLMVTIKDVCGRMSKDSDLDFEQQRTLIAEVVLNVISSIARSHLRAITNAILRTAEEPKEAR